MVQCVTGITSIMRDRSYTIIIKYLIAMSDLDKQVYTYIRNTCIDISHLSVYNIYTYIYTYMVG